MIRIQDKRNAVVLIAAVLIACLGWIAPKAVAEPAERGTELLPGNLFVSVAPENALNVGEARKSAQVTKPLAIRGRVAGAAKPIADGYAIFLVADLGLAPCNSGCADLCHIPHEQLVQNVATVQVVDGAGRPLKVSLEGINGLKPLSEVVIQGTVAKQDQNVLILNAEHIFVAPQTK